MTPRRRSRSARARLSLQFSLTFFLLGTVVIVIIYAVAAGGPTLKVTDVAHASGRPEVVIKRRAPGSGATSTTAFPVPVPPVPLPGDVKAVLVDQHNADVTRLAVISWFVLAITAILSGALGWFGAGRMLRPLRAMTDKARTITAGNLGDRLDLHGPDDEFTRLGDAFDELLGRLERSFDAQRRFVANASHELRTPLTVDRALLQVALSDPTADAGTLRAACDELIESNRNQERLLDGLLTLAVSERGLAEHHPVELGELAGRVLAGFADDARAHEVTIESSLREAPTSGDPALIERLIANLVDNAIRYNEPGGTVAITTAVQDARAELSVTNTGPLIPPYQEEALFEPFRRLRTDRTVADDGHHGLGLSIVRAIAVSHGATVTAASRADGGLSVAVSFPVSASAGDAETKTA
jgi:signal transduction histidine kinase